jgi:hypothetical protein
VKKLQYFVGSFVYFDFTEAEEIYTGWTEIERTPRINNLFKQNQELLMELMMVQSMLQREIEKIEGRDGSEESEE